MLVYGEDSYVAAWVADKIPHVDDFGPSAAIGVLSGGELIAGVVYHDYQKKFGTIQLSMAAISPMWARGKNIHGLLKFPFEDLECYRVFTLTPLDNTKAINVNAHIGFKREAISHSGFGKNRHAVVMRMLLPEYIRLFGDEHGQEQTRPDSS